MVSIFSLRLIFFTAVAISATTRTALADPSQSTRFVLLFIYSPNVRGVENDIRGLTTAFETAIEEFNASAPEQLQVRYSGSPIAIRLDSQAAISNEPISEGALTSQIADVPINAEPETVLVCFFKNHGFVDQDGIRWLLLSDSDKEPRIRRDKLLDLLKNRGTRLTVLLTDACSSCMLAVRTLQHFGPAPTARAAAFRDLFLMPAGVVDCSASTYLNIPHRSDEDPSKAIPGHVIDEAAWTTNSGGFFPSSVVDLLQGGKPAVAKTLGVAEDSLSANLTWSEFGRALATLTDLKYTKWREDVISRVASPEGLALDRVGLLERHMLARQLHQSPQLLAIPKAPTQD